MKWNVPNPMNIFILLSLRKVWMMMQTTTSRYLSSLICFSIFHLRMGMPTNNPKLSAKWVQIKSSSIQPPRSGHVSFVIDQDNSKELFIFGGYAEKRHPEGVNRYAMNDLLRYCFQNKTNFSSSWEIVKQRGDVPSKRLVSASVVLDKRAFIFGGWDPEDPATGGSTFLDTIHSFDPQTHTWTQLPAVIPDGGTSRHVACSLPFQSKAMIHNHRCSNFVYLFDPKSQSIVKQLTGNTQEAPSSRGLHSVCMLDNTYAVFFGGAAQDGNMSNESFLLNTMTWEWKKVVLIGSDNVPSARAGHSMVAFGNKCAIIFGGAARAESGLEPLNDLWALHLDTSSGHGYWENITPNILDDIPQPRNAATLNEIYSREDVGVEKRYILASGWAPFRQTWDDTFILTISCEK